MCLESAELQAVVMALMVAKKYKRFKVELHVNSDFLQSIMRRIPNNIVWPRQGGINLSQDIRRYVEKLHQLMDWMDIDWNFG